MRELISEKDLNEFDEIVKNALSEFFSKDIVENRIPTYDLLQLWEKNNFGLFCLFGNQLSTDVIVEDYPIQWRHGTERSRTEMAKYRSLVSKIRDWIYSDDYILKVHIKEYREIDKILSLSFTMDELREDLYIADEVIAKKGENPLFALKSIIKYFNIPISFEKIKAAYEGVKNGLKVKCRIKLSINPIDYIDTTFNEDIGAYIDLINSPYVFVVIIEDMDSGEIIRKDYYIFYNGAIIGLSCNDEIVINKLAEVLGRGISYNEPANNASVIITGLKRIELCDYLYEGGLCKLPKSVGRVIVHVCPTVQDLVTGKEYLNWNIDSDNYLLAFGGVDQL